MDSFDNIRLEGPEDTRLASVKDVFIRDVYPADYELAQGNRFVQPLIVDLEHLTGNPLLEVELDGKVILKSISRKGVINWKRQCRRLMKNIR